MLTTRASRILPALKNSIGRVPLLYTRPKSYKDVVTRPFASRKQPATANMKRKEAPLKDKSPAKKQRPAVLEYHATPQVKEEDGSIQWPAPSDQMAKARDIIRECATSHRKTLIVPDKDADGLSSGAILRHTLILLGLPPDLIGVHLLSKGNTIHSEAERALMASHSPSYIFVLDQGSRPSKPLIDAPHTALVIDHHHATPSDFPQNSSHVTACTSPPVATSALLTYALCKPLHPEVAATCDWLCIVGTHGDLGNTLKWSPPFPDMREPLKKYTKKLLNDIVSLINAPRRTATYDVASAWTALSTTSEPASILKFPRLLAARAEVNAEVERCTHTPPSFSADGRVAAFRIQSEAQVHPVIATRWAGHLQSNKLEIVLVANSGYLPGMVNFSCRVARCARSKEPAVDIIESLKAFARLADVAGDGDGVVKDEEKGEEKPKPPLIDRLGTDFARGHVQASGGIVSAEHFEELMRLMQIGVKAPKPDPSDTKKQIPARKKAGVIDAGQRNTLAGYFGKQASKKEVKAEKA